MSSAIATGRMLSRLTKIPSLSLRGAVGKTVFLRSLSSTTDSSLRRSSFISRKAAVQTNLSRQAPSSVRPFSATAASLHGHLAPPKPGEELYITFIDKEGDEHKLAVCKGDNLLEIAQTHDIEMEGACEGSCACSTCHIVVEDEAMYDKIPEASDDENDMLDLAFGLTETSRLGCQICMSKELDGLRVKLPHATRNMQASNFGKK
ncbi:putative 2 iron, 2 sulfur cluster binding protein [Halenospora varia]|nr:putative 2 iron, 2 sulfur cluster binding protein [Halenospora varia]